MEGDRSREQADQPIQSESSPSHLPYARQIHHRGRGQLILASLGVFLGILTCFAYGEPLMTLIFAADIIPPFPLFEGNNPQLWFLSHFFGLLRGLLFVLAALAFGNRNRRVPVLLLACILTDVAFVLISLANQLIPVSPLDFSDLHILRALLPFFVEAGVRMLISLALFCIVAAYPQLFISDTADPPPSR